MKTNKIFNIAALLIMLTLFSCGPDTIFLQLKLDTPGHHMATGMVFLKAEKISDAFREFDRAKELDPGYSPAYVGLGLVYGFRGDFEAGLKQMETAASNARGINQKTGVHVGIMRLYMMGQEKIDNNWLEHVKTEFNSATSISNITPGPYYYMGMAYTITSNVEKAAPLFLKVIELDKAYTDEAKMEYDRIKK